MRMTKLLNIAIPQVPEIFTVNFHQIVRFSKFCKWPLSDFISGGRNAPNKNVENVDIGGSCIEAPHATGGIFLNF